MLKHDFFNTPHQSLYQGVYEKKDNFSFVDQKS
jgi:hypothetical protein